MLVMMSVMVMRITVMRTAKLMMKLVLLVSEVQHSTLTRDSHPARCDLSGRGQTVALMDSSLWSFFGGFHLNSSNHPFQFHSNPIIASFAHLLQALHFLGAMASARLAPDVISFNGVISSCAKSSQWRQALQLFQAMAASSQQPDATGTSR